MGMAWVVTMDATTQLVSLMSFGLVAICYAVLAAWVWTQDLGATPLDARKWRLLLVLLCTALWGLVGFLATRTATPALHFLEVALDQVRYALWNLLLLQLLRTDAVLRAETALRWVRPVALGVVMVGLLALLSMALALWPPVQASRLYLFNAMANCVLALFLMEQIARHLVRDAQWNIKLFGVGLAGALCFDLYFFSVSMLFNQVDQASLSLRGWVHASVAPLMWLSLRRGDTWMAHIRVSPHAAFQSTTLLLAGLFLLVISSAGYYVRYFGGAWGPALQLALVFFGAMSFVVLLASGAVRARLRIFLAKNFYRHRFDYRSEWLKFTSTLAAQSAPGDIQLQVIRGLADMLESPAGAIWLKTRDAAAFAATTRWNMADCQQQEQVNSSFCNFLETQASVLDVSTGRCGGVPCDAQQLPKWLKAYPRAWLLVPLLVHGALIGFVLLERPRTEMAVNWEVQDLLKTAGHQAASFIAQMQSTEALMDVKKFEAFNRMSAYIVHDLKNIMSQLSLVVNNSKRLGHNPEFQEDMLLTLENSLKKMHHLMHQLKGGDASAPSTACVDMGAVMARISHAALQRGRTVEAHIAQEVLVRGDEEKLERVMGHLVQNAMEATQTRGHVSVDVEHAGDQAKLVVKDTGQGMPAEFIRDRLFKPFQTTKRAGMGIGAYEVFHYVQELGGRIEVQSSPGQGTCMTVMLPLHRASPGLALKTVAAL